MTERTIRRGGDYQVGYRRPPRATQYRKGESGNPKGRPKGSRSVAAILGDIVRQKVAVTESGKTRWRSRLEVALLRLASAAMRGDPVAIKSLLGLVDRYRDVAEAAPDLNEIRAEDRAILERYLHDQAVENLVPEPKESGDAEDR